MPSSFVVHLPPSRDLPTINAQVAQNELTYGPLIKIGNDGSTTTLTFAAQMPPATTAIVAPQNAGHPVVPAGATLICTGTIFVQGVLTLSAATRL